jgi:seryl-tRNA synthetase
MPIDINDLRAYKGGDPEKFRQYQIQRFKKDGGQVVDDVLAHDQEWRDLRNSIDDLRKSVNKLQKEVIAPAKKAKQDCEDAVAEMKAIQATIKEKEQKLPLVEQARDSLLNKIGNIVDPEVPISNNEDEDNLVIALSPTPPEVEAGVCTLPCAAKSLQYTTPSPPATCTTHDVLLWRIGGYEPVRGQQVGGHRAYFFKDAGVLLNQALINYGIAFLQERGYTILQPPYLMNKSVMASIAQLEDFDEQLYKVSGKTDEDSKDTAASGKYLIATSEQPICAYHAGDWIDPSTLPYRYGGVSTCFRKEAGSSGKDIRGIFRVHQFEKIEQFCLTVDDLAVSSAEQVRMLETAKEFYTSMGIAYRVVCLVSSELNDAAIKKYDLEGWFPGQGTYRELVSCSNCTDYQARGVGVRCGMKKAATDLTARASYCHMLNATLCATGRAICAILETHQTETGVKVPEVLRPFMGGRDFLPFVRDPPELTKGEKGVAK